MKTRISLMVALLFALVSLTPSAGLALVILEDNFDTEHGGVGILNYNDFDNWDVPVVTGTVDLIGNNFYDFLPGNGLYVDMDGSTGNAGKMTSIDLLLDPGEYLLEFDLAGNHRNASPEQVIVQVALGSLFSESYSLARLDPFTDYAKSFAVVSAQTVALSFEGVGGDNIGMLLDNVKLTKVSIPDASTILLLGSACLIGFSGLRRKYTK